MSKKPVIQPQDKFVLRLPDGLRDRIKAVADREGTSMNHEIVRVLEREFPEQWPLASRLDLLGKLFDILQSGKADPRIGQFVEDFRETVEGVVTGRVPDVDLEIREAIVAMWSDYLKREDAEDLDSIKTSMDGLTEEEARNYALVGRSEKFAFPPKRRKEFHELSVEEREQYLEELRKLPYGKEAKMPPKDD